MVDFLLQKGILSKAFLTKESTLFIAESSLSSGIFFKLFHEFLEAFVLGYFSKLLCFACQHVQYAFKGWSVIF